MTRFPLVIAALLVAGAAQAQDMRAGASLYATYCASCHGDTLQGDGMMTGVLNIAVPDLTGIAARNGGVFPRVMVVYRIDGRDPIPAHGGDMPYFGDLFEGDMAPMKAETGQPILTGRGIVDLVAFLEGMQG